MLGKKLRIGPNLNLLLYYWTFYRETKVYGYDEQGCFYQNCEIHTLRLSGSDPKLRLIWSYNPQCIEC